MVDRTLPDLRTRGYIVGAGRRRGAFSKLTARERVLLFLDQATSDVYPADVRERLADCALRHVADEAETPHRLFRRAIKWLREHGHING